MGNTPDYSIILQAIETMQKSHNECVTSLRDEIKTGLRGSAIQIEAEMSVVNAEIRRLAEHVEKQNGNVARLQDESNIRKTAVDDFYKLKGSLIAIKKKWALIVIVVIIVMTIIGVVIDIVGVKKVAEEVWDKIP